MASSSAPASSPTDAITRIMERDELMERWVADAENHLTAHDVATLTVVPNTSGLPHKVAVSLSFRVPEPRPVKGLRWGALLWPHALAAGGAPPRALGVPSSLTPARETVMESRLLLNVGESNTLSVRVLDTLGVSATESMLLPYGLDAEIAELCVPHEAMDDVANAAAMADDPNASIHAWLLQHYRLAYLLRSGVGAAVPTQTSLSDAERAHLRDDLVGIIDEHLHGANISKQLHSDHSASSLAHDCRTDDVELIRDTLAVHAYIGDRGLYALRAVAAPSLGSPAVDGSVVEFYTDSNGLGALLECLVRARLHAGIARLLWTLCDADNAAAVAALNVRLFKASFVDSRPPAEALGVHLRCLTALLGGVLPLGSPVASVASVLGMTAWAHRPTTGSGAAVGAAVKSSGSAAASAHAAGAAEKNTDDDDDDDDDGPIRDYYPTVGPSTLELLQLYVRIKDAHPDQRALLFSPHPDDAMTPLQLALLLPTARAQVPGGLARAVLLQNTRVLPGSVPLTHDDVGDFTPTYVSALLPQALAGDRSWESAVIPNATERLLLSQDQVVDDMEAVLRQLLERAANGEHFDAAVCAAVETSVRAVAPQGVLVRKGPVLAMPWAVGKKRAAAGAPAAAAAVPSTKVPKRVESPIADGAAPVDATADAPAAAPAAAPSGSNDLGDAAVFKVPAPVAVASAPAAPIAADSDAAVFKVPAPVTVPA